MGLFSKFAVSLRPRGGEAAFHNRTSMFEGAVPRRQSQFNLEGGDPSANELRIAYALNTLRALDSIEQVAHQILQEFGVLGLDPAVRLLRSGAEECRLPGYPMRKWFDAVRDQSGSLGERVLAAILLNEAFREPESRPNGFVSRLVETPLNTSPVDRALVALALRGVCNDRLVSNYHDSAILYSRGGDSDAQILFNIGIAGLFSMRDANATLERRAWQTLKTLSEKDTISLASRKEIAEKLEWNLGSNDLDNIVIRSVIGKNISSEGVECVEKEPISPELRYPLAIQFAKILLNRYGLSACEAAGALVRCAKPYHIAEKLPDAFFHGRIEVVADENFHWRDRFLHALMLYHDSAPERFLELLSDESKETQILGALILWAQRSPAVATSLQRFIEDSGADLESKLLAQFVLAHQDEIKSSQALRYLERAALKNLDWFKRVQAIGRACQTPEEIFVNYQYLGNCWC